MKTLSRGNRGLAPERLALVLVYARGLVGAATELWVERLKAAREKRAV